MSHNKYRSKKIKYRFATINLLSSGICCSPDYSIEDVSGKGKSLFFTKYESGLLIPYGGVLSSGQEMEEIKRNSTRKEKDYLICGQSSDFFWNGNPDMAPSDLMNCWPGALVNEPTEGSAELFNCVFVTLKCCDYPDMPVYPGIEKCDEMIFLECMCSRKSGQGPMEAFVSYNKARESGSGRQQVSMYVAKFEHWGNVDKGGLQYGNHWVNSGVKVVCDDIEGMKDEYFIGLEETNALLLAEKNRLKVIEKGIASGSLCKNGRKKPPVFRGKLKFSPYDNPKRKYKSKQYVG